MGGIIYKSNCKSMGVCISSKVSGKRMANVYDKRRPEQLKIDRSVFGGKNKTPKENFVCFLAGKWLNIAQTII